MRRAAAPQGTARSVLYVSPVFVNTVRASFYRFRSDLGGLRVGREILVWRTFLRQCVSTLDTLCLTDTDMEQTTQTTGNRR